jgi:hypothetical protein
MGRLLGHAAPGTRGAKASFFTAKSKQHLVRTVVTAQAHKAVGQDTAPQVSLKFLLDIRGQAFGSGISREGGPKRFEMFGDDLVEDALTGVSRLVSRRYHMPAFNNKNYCGHRDDQYYTFVHYIISKPLCLLKTTSIRTVSTFLDLIDDGNRYDHRL